MEIQKDKVAFEDASVKFSREILFARRCTRATIKFSRCGVAFKFNRRGVAQDLRLNLASAEIFVCRVNFKI